MQTNDLVGVGPAIGGDLSTAGSGGLPVPEINSDILCRGCGTILYTKVTNAATAHSGKSWRCGACHQLFTVKSSAKRHVTNSHKDPLCQGCQNPMMNGVAAAAYGNSGSYAVSSGNSPSKPGTPGTGWTSGDCPIIAVSDRKSPNKSGTSGADGSSIDADDDDQDEEMDLEPELALLTLMLKNHLDLKGVDNVLELLNGGMDFSQIQNASHWLQRLGKHAAVQYTTSNCPNCKRTEVQIKVDQTTSMPPGLDGLTPHTLTMAPAGGPLGMRNDAGQPPMGTVLGVFDPSSGQIITASHVSLDKNMLQKMVHTVPGQMNGGPGVPIRPMDAQHLRNGLPPSASLINFTTPVSNPANVAPPAPSPPRKVSSKAKAPSTPHPAGSVNTSWKAVARTFLHSLHTKDELLRLCVVGRRMDRTSALGLQPMDAGKRKIVGDAVAEHCTKVGIPVPPDTLLNHFMSQILCDSRRKEQLVMCGGELQRRPPKKVKSEPTS